MNVLSGGSTEVNISNFISKSSFEAIRWSMKQRKAFEYQKEVKTKEGKFQVHLDAKYMNPDVAEKIWNGQDYIFGVDVNYIGPKVGFGGMGHCFSNYEEIFSSWDSFKKWFDKQMKPFEKYGYETDDEYGQMSLFE